MQLNSTYDFAVSVFEERSVYREINNDLYELFLTLILTGKRNYNRDMIENQIDFYIITNAFSFEMVDVLFNIIEEQHIELPTFDQ